MKQFLFLFLFVLVIPTHAHGNLKGVEAFFDGFLHPLLNLELLFGAISVGIFSSGYFKEPCDEFTIHSLLTFLIAGLLASLYPIPAHGLEIAVISCMVILSLLAVLKWKTGRIIGLVTFDLGLFLIASASLYEKQVVSFTWLGNFGTWVGTATILQAVYLLRNWLDRKDLYIVLRILSAWIVTICILWLVVRVKSGV